jgi:NAD(P)-dependent dehydrogenase (short-subunit alcohol dehydrogenase family)
MPGTYQAVYNATKAFVDSFSFALRAELKDSGVTVTCLMPGDRDRFLRAGRHGISTGKIRVMLTVLKQAGLIRERRGPRFQVMPSPFVESAESVAAAYEARRQRDQTKLEQTVVYAQTVLCRTAACSRLSVKRACVRCHACDNCRGTAIRAEAVAEGAA